MHLDTEILLAYRDGELVPHRMKKVESHLASCARCRQEASQLEYELALFRTLPAAGAAPEAALLEGALEKMLAGIHKWRSQACPGETASLQLDHRVTAHLAEYLGSRAAAGVANSANSSKPDATESLPVAESLLSAFLGRKAASALTSELLLAMALDRGLVPELLP
jgi:anti-sigma factor RsiW